MTRAVLCGWSLAAALACTGACGGGGGGGSGGGGGHGGAGGLGGSDGSMGGLDASRFEACVPSCLAQLFAACEVPAGPCTREEMPGTSYRTYCYQNDVQRIRDGVAGQDSIDDAWIYVAGAKCYSVYGSYDAANPIRADGGLVANIETLRYGDYRGFPVGTITMDPGDPLNQKGTARCENGGPAQAFDLGSPACSFLARDGVAYEDATMIGSCVPGDAGSCPLPPGFLASDGGSP